MMQHILESRIGSDSILDMLIGEQNLLLREGEASHIAKDAGIPPPGARSGVVE